MNVKKAFLTLILGILFSSHIFANSVMQPVTDTVNAGIINSNMIVDSSLAHINVSATVSNGIAIFNGDVNSDAQIHELVRIAHSVSGIRGVDISKVKVASHP